MGRLIMLSCDRCGRKHPVHPQDPFRIPEGWMHIDAESVFVGAHGYAQQEICPACIAADPWIKTVYDRTREFAVEEEGPSGEEEELSEDDRIRMEYIRTHFRRRRPRRRRRRKMNDREEGNG